MVEGAAGSGKGTVSGRAGAERIADKPCLGRQRCPRRGRHHPTVTGRVVAGSRMVPVGNLPAQGVRPGTSSDQVGEISVIAISLENCWDSPGLDGSLAPAQSFIVGEEKYLVANHGPANRKTELVQAKFALLIPPVLSK